MSPLRSRVLLKMTSASMAKDIERTKAKFKNNKNKKKFAQRQVKDVCNTFGSFLDDLLK